MKSLISSEVEDFLSDNHLRMIVKQLDQRFLHIDIIYSSTQITRGAFAIVPGAGGLAAKSLLKHMPALKTVMKTVSKPVNDAVKPIKSTVDSIGLKGNQSIETVITKKQKQVSPVISNLKPGKQSITPGVKTVKNRDALDIPTKSKFATKIENAKELGKAHVDQLKFALTHPIIATVTSKAGQKSIRGTAKYIDNALRPVEVRTEQTTMGNKVFAGFERGESTGKLTGKADNYIAIKQAEKDVIKGTKGTGNLKNIDEFIAGTKNFDDVLVDFARLYSEKIQTNKTWSWNKSFHGGEYLTARQRKLIKEKAIVDGLIPNVNVHKADGMRYGFADFKSAGLVVETKDLPESLWLKSDEAQFEWLDNVIGGRPEGMTWHHTEIAGKMELVPFGIHNITIHNGGRSIGMWADAPR